MPLPLVISHRAHTGSMPENTLAGIEAALAERVDGIEVDVRATADGALVLVHDETLERTAGLALAVAECSLEDLRGARLPDPFGRIDPQPVPTLDEALAAIDARALVVLDICARGLVEPITEAVRRAGAEAWCRITTPDLDEAAAFAEALPAARTLLTVPYRLGTPEGLRAAVEAARLAGLAGINPTYRVVDADIVLEAHRAGLEFATWTVNEPAEIERMCALGVDSITSDYPGRLLDHLAAGQEQPLEA
jgi:glycerophosphoryl diester phosphodiesterase